MMHWTFSDPPREDSDRAAEVLLDSRPPLRGTELATDGEEECFLGPALPVGAAPRRGGGLAVSGFLRALRWSQVWVHNCPVPGFSTFCQKHRSVAQSCFELLHNVLR